MKNKDFIMTQTQMEIAQRISNAAREGNAEEFEAGIQSMFENIQASILEQAAEMRSTADEAALAQRGVRVLTSQERTFYNALIEALKDNNGNISMALTNVDKTFPITIISQVMEDMKQSHPLLAAVDTLNVTGITNFLVNIDEGGTASWGEINSAITQEIASGFDNIQLGQFKLSAYMPISQDMLELGPVWMDSYIRTCLSEALALGYETAIVTGTGKNQPIGMDRNVADNVEVTGGVYPQKDKVSVTDFGVSTYGNLLSKLAFRIPKAEEPTKGKYRPVKDLILVCNPADYFKLVMPATTLVTQDGHHVNDVLPVPTQIIQSVAVASGEAILGMGKRYFLGVGGKRGIQFSDDYKFIEDQRYYKIVAYGNGKPKDNQSFLRLDISELEPKYWGVQVKGSVTTTVEGTVTTATDSTDSTDSTDE